jgi:hypothetical protein
MEPVWQDAHRVATDPAKEPPDPDLDPADLRQATDMTKIQPMSD